MKSRKLVRLTVGALVFAIAPFASTVSAQEDDSVDVRVFKKKVQISCNDGENCPGGFREIVIDGGAHDRKVVFIGDDGETSVLGGDGNTWISHGGEHAFSVHVGRGFLGVQLTELTNDLRDHFGVPQGQGVMVSRVDDDSPAFRAGIQAGDIITAVAGTAIADGGSLGRAVRKFEDGDVADLELWRDGSVLTLSAQIEERKESERRFAFRSGDEAGDANVFFFCDEEDGDCPESHNFSWSHSFPGAFKVFSNLDCDGKDCDISVQCENDECVCIVNGEEQPCE